jgi:hypothetical protein
MAEMNPPRIYLRDSGGKRLSQTALILSNKYVPIGIDGILQPPPLENESRDEYALPQDQDP